MTRLGLVVVPSAARSPLLQRAAAATISLKTATNSRVDLPLKASTKPQFASQLGHLLGWTRTSTRNHWQSRSRSMTSSTRVCCTGPLCTECCERFLPRLRSACCLQACS